MTKKLSDERLVTVFKNQDGQLAFQPTLPSGERLYYDCSVSGMYGFFPDRVWRRPPRYRFAYWAEPVLHNSERRAHREALREQKSRDKEERRIFREVTG